MPRGRPKEGEQHSVRLSAEDKLFAQTLSPIGELSDGLRRALDEAREQRGLPLPKRPAQRRKPRSR
jgi:hypothetical protein